MDIKVYSKANIRYFDSLASDSENGFYFNKHFKNIDFVKKNFP